MSESNFAELRRVRSEMSAEAGHDVRRFIELLDGVRAKYRDHLVDHGADAEQSDVLEPPRQSVRNADTAPAGVCVRKVGEI